MGAGQAAQLVEFAFDGLRFVFGGATTIALIAAYILLLIVVVLGVQFVLHS